MRQLLQHPGPDAASMDEVGAAAEEVLGADPVDEKPTKKKLSKGARKKLQKLQKARRDFGLLPDGTPAGGAEAAAAQYAAARERSRVPRPKAQQHACEILLRGSARR